MHTLSILTSVAILVSPILAQSNILQLLAQIPSCTQPCNLKVLDPVGCQLTNLTECLCPSVDLQRELALCVLQSCNTTEQTKLLTVLQNDICEGTPEPSRSEEIIRDIIIMAAVTFTVIILRFISRSMVANKIGWDDWAVGLGAIIMVPMTVIPILNATRGFGKHFWNVPPQNLLGLRKLYYISQILYILLQALAKISILLLYLRIFLNKHFRLATLIVITGIVAQTISFVVVVCFQCIPINSYWDLTVHGKCIDSQAFVYTAAALSIFEDFVVMFLPLWELKGLKLDIRRKFALGFIFALGSFACITSMIRLKYIISYGDSIDLTYDNVDVIIWSVIETFTAIICASLMCFRPLLLKILPSVFQSTKTGSKHTPNPSWGQLVRSKVGIRSRSGDNRIELSSLDEDSKRLRGREIRVQTTLVMETTVRDSEEREHPEKLDGRAASQSSAYCSEF